MKKRLLSMLLILSMSVLSACSGSNTAKEESSTAQGETRESAEESAAPGEKTFKDTIEIGLDVDADVIDPRKATNVTSKRCIEFVYDGLVELDANLEPQPSLAESWEQVDEITWIFNLRKNVKFHDGSDFTAEDVKYTYDCMLDPDFAAVGAANYNAIKEVTIQDDYTVTFKLSEPYAPLLAVMDLGIVPSDSGDKEDFGNQPVGTGPFKFSSWTKNDKITFEANADYWNGAPNLKTVNIHIIPENSTRVAALESGDVDLIHTPLTAEDIAVIKVNQDFTVYETSGLGLTMLYFNWNNEILADQNVRIALAHLIDKFTIATSIYNNTFTPAGSAILPNSWAYSDTITSYDFDQEKAVQILKEAGWTDSDGDGILDKDGKKLSLTLMTHSEDSTRIQTIEYIQNVLNGVGIDAKVETKEWATFFPMVQSGDYDIALAGLLNIYDPDKYLYGYFHSGSDSNYGGYNSPELDAYVEAARSSSDTAVRAENYQKAAQIINDEVMHDVVLYQSYCAIYTNKLQGYTPYASTSFRGLIYAELAE